MDEAEEGEEADEDDDEDEDDAEGEADEEGAERPKLDEGFYEIEAVRRKRVRKVVLFPCPLTFYFPIVFKRIKTPFFASVCIITVLLVLSSW